MWALLRRSLDLFRLCTASCLMTAGTGSSIPMTLMRKSGLDNKWLDGMMWVICNGLNGNSLKLKFTDGPLTI